MPKISKPVRNDLVRYWAKMSRKISSNPRLSKLIRELRKPPPRLYLLLALVALFWLNWRPTVPPTYTEIFDTDYAQNNRAIFLISMGMQAQRSKIVERFVWSIKNRGKWNGWTVLLTDAPKSRYANLTDQWIVMNPQQEHFNASFAQDMPYKRFKTYIMDYMNMDHRLDDVSLIYYLDVDIIAIRPLLPMMLELEKKHNIVTKRGVPKSVMETPQAWFFEGNYKKTPVQGGQMILDRYSSEPCLQRWRSLIDANPSQPKDQPFLLEMLEHPNKDCLLRIMPKENYLSFPSNESMLRWIDDGYHFRLRKQPEQTVPTMIHIKNSGKAGNISATLEGTYLQRVMSLRKGEEQQLEISRKIHFKPDQGY